MMDNDGVACGARKLGTRDNGIHRAPRPSHAGRRNTPRPAASVCSRLRKAHELALSFPQRHYSALCTVFIFLLLS